MGIFFYFDLCSTTNDGMFKSNFHLIVLVVRKSSVDKKVLFEQYCSTYWTEVSNTFYSA